MSRETSLLWFKSAVLVVLLCKFTLPYLHFKSNSIRAFILCDRIGRLWATRQLCCLWILGIVIFLTNGGRLGQVYAGRFIAGLGIGQTTVVAPVYLSEIAPKSVRGLCTCAFSGSVYIGIMLAYFASWGSQLHIKEGTTNQWVSPSA